MKEFNFIGSDAKRTFDECIEHVRGSANYVYGKGYFEETVGITSLVDTINTGKGNVLFCMRQIGWFFHGDSSLKLLTSYDLKAFKKSSYISAKLTMLGCEKANWGYSSDFFLIVFSSLMSDSRDLLQFLVRHQNEIAGNLETNQYVESNLYAYSNLNTLLAITGQWEQLKKRLLVFLSDDKNKKSYLYLPEYEFYLALCHQDREGMMIAINKMLEKKFVKKVMYGADVFFDFYLQMRALICGKIAAIHGFDLGIDSPYAPKELIEYKPLDRYEDPYDFMKEFDYNQPQQVWIDKWNEKMRLAKEREEAEKKKGFFARLFGKLPQ